MKRKQIKETSQNMCNNIQPKTKQRTLHFSCVCVFLLFRFQEIGKLAGAGKKGAKYVQNNVLLKFFVRACTCLNRT